MLSTLLLGQITWTPFVWSLLGLTALVGLVAIVSPSSFAAMATRGGQWVDTDRLFAVFDRRWDIDSHILPYSRLLGAAVLAAVVILALVLRHGYAG